MSKPTDLVQGTLDLLILRVMALEPMHGWAIAHGSARCPTTSCESDRARSTRRSTSSSSRGGLRLSGLQREQSPREVLHAHGGRPQSAEGEAAQWERLSAAISLVVRPA